MFAPIMMRTLAASHDDFWIAKWSGVSPNLKGEENGEKEV
jgi:hypothetical protein